MIATNPSDPVSTFNDHLAEAKLAALRILQDLMSTLTDIRHEEQTQSPNWPGREMRLIATAILRTKPLAPNTPTPPPADVPAPRPQTRQPADNNTPPAPTSPTPPSPLRVRLDPLAARARRDIRTLVRDGVLPASFLVEAAPAAPASAAAGPAP